MYPTLSQHCKEGLTFSSWLVGQLEFKNLWLLFCCFKESSPVPKIQQIIITVCIFNYNNSRQHLAKWQVLSSPSRGAANFKNKFCTSRDAKIDISVKTTIVPLVSW